MGTWLHMGVGCGFMTLSEPVYMFVSDKPLRNQRKLKSKGADEAQECGDFEISGQETFTAECKVPRAEEPWRDIRHSHGWL